MDFKEKFYQFLKWLERYTQTDMIYLAQGGFWWILGKILTFFISLVTLIAFARFSPKEVYGGYQYILSVAGVLVIFSLPGIDIALIRSVAQGKEKIIFPCLKEKIKFGGLGSLIAFFVSLWYFLHQNSELGFSFLIMALFLPFLNSFLIYFYFWHGKKKFDIQNKYFIWHNFLAGIVLILVIFLTKNLILIVLTYFLAFTLAEGIFLKLTLKKVSDGDDAKETISFGKHLTLMQSASLFSEQIDKIILWQFLGPLAVAVWSFAQKPVLRCQEIIPISPLALPKLSQVKVKERKNQIFKKFLKLFWFSIPLTILYILACPIFFRIFFPTYLEAVPYSQGFSLILIFVPFLLLQTAFLAEMRKKELYILNFVSPILKTILFLILIPLFEIWGIVASFLISQIFSGLLSVYFFRRI